MLQTRSGKRTGYAAVVIATDLAAEKIVSPKDALLLVDPEALSQLLSPGFDPAEWAKVPVLAKGLPASPGAASGQVVFTADDAVEWTRHGKQVILVRKETVPGRYSRYARRAGHFDRHRRHDVACSGRRPPDGQAVHRRRRHVEHFGERQAVHGGRQGRQRRRLRVVRRPEGGDQAREDGVEAQRDSAGRQRPAGSEEVGHLPALQQDSRVGRQGAAARHPRERGSAGPGRAGVRVRRARHRTVPDRAHVLRRRPAADRAAHDPGGQPSRSEEGGVASCCRCSGATSTACSRP